MIWAHLLQEQKLVLYKAMAALGIAALQKLLTRSAGPFPIQQGTILSLLLQIEGVTVANPHGHVTWTGAAGYANFIFTVPPDAAEGTRKAVCFIRANGLEIARIDFLLRIGKERKRQTKVPADVIRYQKAFASYASEDRDAVLAHIHGMQKSAPHLDVFVDVMTLRSGEDWAQRLEQVIPEVDVFYLFWCRHALESEWVDKEWRCAYNSRGLAFIDPVPLEPPDVSPGLKRPQFARFCS